MPCKGKERLAQSLASSCRMRYIETVERETREGIKRYELSFGVLNVALPRHPGTPLRLVVVRGFGEEPMMLLTTLALTDSRKSLWQVVEGYLTRWRVEDTLRYIKQCYHLEDLRVLTYRRLNLMTTGWSGRRSRSRATGPPPSAPVATTFQVPSGRNCSIVRPCRAGPSSCGFSTMSFEMLQR